MFIHIYNHMRRILHRLNCRIPGGDGFNQYNNSYYEIEYYKFLNITVLMETLFY